MCVCIYIYIYMYTYMHSSRHKPSKVRPRKLGLTLDSLCIVSSNLL